MDRIDKEHIKSIVREFKKRGDSFEKLGHAMWQEWQAQTAAGMALDKNPFDLNCEELRRTVKGCPD